MSVVAMVEHGTAVMPGVEEEQERQVEKVSRSTATSAVSAGAGWVLIVQNDQPGLAQLRLSKHHTHADSTLVSPSRAATTGWRFPTLPGLPATGNHDQRTGDPSCDPAT